MEKLILVLVFVSLLIACGDSAPGSWKEHNLLRYDLPISVMGPDSVTIEANNLLFDKDITIEGALDKSYGIQIFSSDARSQDVKKVKAEELADTKLHKFFDELIEDNEDGFIYSTRIDSSNIYHAFKYVKIQGDKEYIYQNLSGRQYSIDDVRKMYSAIQPKKK